MELKVVERLKITFTSLQQEASGKVGKESVALSVLEADVSVIIRGWIFSSLSSPSQDSDNKIK